MAVKETTDKTESEQELNGDEVRSALLAFRVLEYLVEAGAPCSVTESALALGITKTRLFRCLRTLIAAGYVEQDSSSRYVASSRIYLLGQAYASHRSLLREAQPHLEMLSQRTHQTATLSQLEESGMRILGMARTRNAIEITTRTGTLMQFHSSAQGLLGLGFGPERLLEQQRWVKLERLTDHTLTDYESLLRRVEQVRRQRWSVSPETMLVGINALAAPIFDHGGQLVGTIAIVGSVQFVPPTPYPEQIAAVTEAAARISQALGFEQTLHNS
ncbi:MAG: IclR family transcriptional regulator [Rhizobiaceae bacterium]|nr:IclR family transcriptional regulator [Rhizobiaceae bacterium]